MTVSVSGFMSRRPRLHRVNWLLLAVLGIGFCVRIVGINWGLPYLYHPDEFQVVQVYLTMVENLDMNPHWFTYPSLMMYANALMYGLYFVARHLLGSFHRADIAYPQVPVMGT
jgi:hypothetical protein